MQTTPDYSDKALRNLLKEIPEEKLSAGFRTELMGHIFHENGIRKRRNLWAIWSCGTITCFSIITSTILIFRYLSIDFGTIFNKIFILPEIRLQDWGAYVFIGILALLLLVIDFRLRKIFLK